MGKERLIKIISVWKNKKFEWEKLIEMIQSKDHCINELNLAFQHSYNIHQANDKLKVIIWDDQFMSCKYISLIIFFQSVSLLQIMSILIQASTFPPCPWEYLDVSDKTTLSISVSLCETACLCYMSKFKWTSLFFVHHEAHRLCNVSVD